MTPKPGKSARTRSKINQFISVKRNQVIILVSMSLGGLLVLACFGLVLLYLAGMLPGGQGAQAAGAVQPCGQPKFWLGSESYPLETMKLPLYSSGGPPNAFDGTAYWIEGTRPNSVLFLKSSGAILDKLGVVRPGEAVKIAWGDCSQEEYALQSVEQGQVREQVDRKIPTAGVTLVVANAVDQPGLVLHAGAPEGRPAPTQAAAQEGSPAPTQAGAQESSPAPTQASAQESSPAPTQASATGQPRPEGTLVVTDTPAPGGPGIEAEIGLLDTSTSDDRASVIVRVSIRNYGAAAFQVTENDISVTPQGGQAMKVTSAGFALPQEIVPGETKEFTFIFPRPQAKTAVLKVFTVEFDLSGY